MSGSQGSLASPSSSSVSSSMATPPPLPAFLPPGCPIPRLSLTAPESFSPLLYYGNFGRSSRTLPCDASHMMTMAMAMALPQAKPVFVKLSAAHRAKQPAKNPHRQTTRKQRRRDRLGTHTKHKRHTDLHSVECMNPGSLDGYHSPLPLPGIVGTCPSLLWSAGVPVLSNSAFPVLKTVTYPVLFTVMFPVL